MSARVLWRMVAMNVMMTLAYRGAFLIYMVNTVAVPLISLLVWLTVSEQGVRLPYTPRPVRHLLRVAQRRRDADRRVAGRLRGREIRLGGLSPWLLRPAPYIVHRLGNNIGEKIIKLPLLLPLVVVVAVAFRRDLRLPAASGPGRSSPWPLTLAAALAFLLDFCDRCAGLLGPGRARAGPRSKTLAAALLAGAVRPAGPLPPQPGRLPGGAAVPLHPLVPAGSGHRAASPARRWRAASPGNRVLRAFWAPTACSGAMGCAPTAPPGREYVAAAYAKGLADGAAPCLHPRLKVRSLPWSFRARLTQGERTP